MGDIFGWRSRGVMVAERNCFWEELIEVKIGGETGIIYILVQLRAVEGFLRETENPCVAGSIPALATILASILLRQNH